MVLRITLDQNRRLQNEVNVTKVPMNSGNDDINGKVKELHQVYCESAGMKVSLGFDRERSWYDFIQAGFDRDDLKLVIGYLLKAVGRGDRNPGSLRFRNLVGQLDAFEEELAMAKAHRRNFKVETPKDKAIRELRPAAVESAVKDTVKPMIVVTRNAIEELRKAVG